MPTSLHLFVFGLQHCHHRNLFLSWLILVLRNVNRTDLTFVEYDSYSLIFLIWVIQNNPSCPSNSQKILIYVKGLISSIIPEELFWKNNLEELPFHLSFQYIATLWATSQCIDIFFLIPIFTFDFFDWINDSFFRYFNINPVKKYCLSYLDLQNFGETCSNQ